jgi:predicted Zn-dependent protease with MMP-like domain
MDRTDQSGDWADRLSPDLATIESIALTAYSHLPQEFRDPDGDVQILIADFPTEEISDDLGLETPFDLARPVRGPRHRRALEPRHRREANRITLYRRAILDYWAENEESLGDIITHVLIHELGHHFGLRMPTWRRSRKPPSKHYSLSGARQQRAEGGALKGGTSSSAPRH